MPSRKSILALALAGLTLGLAACDSTKPVDNSTPDQKAAFRALCATKGGKINETTCKGLSQCHGLYLDGATAKQTVTECKGLNNCAGLQCLDTTVTKKDSAAARAALLAAKDSTEFKMACKAAGKMATTDSTCAGHNSCAGVRFLSGTAKTEETSCSGKGSCQGLSCPL